jgi:hypothetical protein
MVPGCTDEFACNFDALATANDGSCDYSCVGCTDPLAYNYDASYTIDDGSCLYGCPAGAIAITIPYAGVGLTNCGSGNSVTSANASVVGGTSYYLNGEDAVYEFTASGNDSYIVDLAAAQTYSGVWVYEGCPTTGGTVVAFAGAGFSNTLKHKNKSELLLNQQYKNHYQKQ